MAAARPASGSCPEEAGGQERQNARLWHSAKRSSAGLAGSVAAEARPPDQGVDCVIASDAVVTDSVLWDRVTVGAGARLIECVAADDVVIPAGVEFSRSTLVMRDNTLVVQEFKASQVQGFTGSTVKAEP